MSVLFRAGWSQAQGRTGVTEEELDKAARVAVGLLAALGHEGNPTVSDTTKEADELRLRAYTLLYRAYDECRRAVAYLRWHEDDANNIAPPLTGPRGGRTRKAERDDDGGGNDNDPSGGPTPPK